jgi:photosystem II stability/assembly factor-like uncharacterized protein
MNFVAILLLLIAQDTVRTFRGVSYLEGHTWVVDYDTFNLNNIYYSPDDGFTWFSCGVLFFGEYPPLFDIEFVNDTIGWAMGGPGLIFKSTDGCGTWEEQLYGVPKWWAKAHFIDENVGWFAGGDAFYGKTIDGGDSIYANTTINGLVTDFYGVAAFNADVAWLAGGRPADIPGGQGYIVLTKDGGEHWSILDSSIVYDYLDLFFISPTKGWCVGGTDTIPYTPVVKITEDGGATWIDIVPPVGNTLRSVQFINENEGWVCGKFGTILHTTDGGYTWEEQFSGTQATLFALEFYDSLHGVVVGDSGVVLFTENGGETWELRSPITGVKETSNLTFDNLLVRTVGKGVELTVKGEGSFRFLLYDIGGRRIREFYAHRGKYIIPVEKTGIYFLEVLKRGKRRVYKIAIIR